MSAAPSPSRRRRARPPVLSPEGYTAAEWERDFRDDVKESIARLAETQQKMAILLEDYGGRIKALEKQPEEHRAAVNSSSARDAARYAIGALLFAVISFALTHLSFH